MATIPELLNGHVTLEIECLDRLYLNGYIGTLVTGPQLSWFIAGAIEEAGSLAQPCWAKSPKDSVVR